MTALAITLIELDLKRDATPCPACGGDGYASVACDADGDHGLPCEACHTTGEARYCAYCTAAGAPAHEVFEAAYELRAGDQHRRTCVRYECVGQAITELRALVALASRPGLASTRPATGELAAEAS